MIIDLDTIGFFLFMEEQEKKQQGIFVVENEDTISKEDGPHLFDFPNEK